MTFPEWAALLPVLVVWAQGLVIVLVGLAVARVGRGLTRRAVRDRLTPQQVMIAERTAYWVVIGLTLAAALRQVGFDLSVFLGAAGILTVAIGFASQTSASNLISGLFLLGERPFVVGDAITVGGTTGVVVAIDLLSVKLRTFDNRLVRLPNETLLKVEIVNLTHHRIRRVDVVFQVAYGTSLPKVRRVLVAAAEALDDVLDEPRPAVWFDRFADSGISVQVSVWTVRERFVDAKEALVDAIIATFEREGITFPFPTQRLGTDPGAPIEVRVVSEPPEA